MVKTKFYAFEEFVKKDYRSGSWKGYTQLMEVYRICKKMNKPMILELGTHKGASTTVFLQICEENDGKLVSVDKHDWSQISDSERWKFVQSDSTDIKNILSQVPELNNGIDVLFIDTLHTKKHVQKELTTWYPLLKDKSHIFFDDVDPSPYRKGNRKDDIYNEINWREIRAYVESFYYSNEKSLYLNIMYGATGLAHLYKLSPLNTMPNETKTIKYRKKGLSYFYHSFKKSSREYLSHIKNKVMLTNESDSS